MSIMLFDIVTNIYYWGTRSVIRDGSLEKLWGSRGWGEPKLYNKNHARENFQKKNS